MGRSAGRHRALVRRPRPGPRRPRLLLRPAPTPDPPEEGPGITMTRSEAARLGGRARAARLAPERRRAIAAMGFQALVDQRFGGDRRAAIEWLVAAGLAAQDRQLREALRSLGGSGAIVPLADDPGPMPPPATPEDLHQVMPEDLHQVEADELPF